MAALARHPADDALFQSFARALADVLRQDSALAEQLENRTRRNVPPSPQELASATDQVRRALLDGVGKHKFRTQLDIPPKERDAALRLLAQEGFRLYQKIFYHPAGGADARPLGDWLG